VTSAMDLITAALRELRDLPTVVVGGSTARGDFVRGWSDVDLLLIVDRLPDALAMDVVTTLLPVGAELGCSISASVATHRECLEGTTFATGLTGKEIRMLKKLGQEAKHIAGPKPSIGRWVVEADLTFARSDIALFRREVRRLTLSQTVTPEAFVKCARHMNAIARLHLRLIGIDCVGYEEVAEAIAPFSQTVGNTLSEIAQLRRMWLSREAPLPSPAAVATWSERIGALDLVSASNK
jgi:hypothetical protein